MNTLQQHVKPLAEGVDKALEKVLIDYWLVRQFYHYGILSDFKYFKHGC